MPSPAIRKSTSIALTVKLLPPRSTSPVASTSTRARWDRKYPSTAAAMMMAPPIVGVPRLVWWVVGPSSRMNWP